MGAKRCCFLFFVFIALLLWSGVVLATDWAFSPSITVSEQYDSNVFFLDDNVEDDFVTLFKPVFSLTGDSEKTSFRTDVTVQGEKYVDHTDQDDILYDARISLSRALTQRFSTALSTSFIKDTTLETQLEESGIRSNRADRHRFDFGLKETFAATDRLSFDFSESASTSLYPEDTNPDTQNYQLGLTPSWLLTQRDTTGLAVSASLSDYEDDSSIEALQSSLFWRRTLSETSSLQFGAGLRITRTESPTYSFKFGKNGALRLVEEKVVSNDTGPIFNAVFEKAWSERFRTTFSAGKEQYNSSDAVSFDRTYGGATLSYGVSERTQFACDFRYDHNTETGQVDDTRDYFRLSPSVERKLTENFSLRLRGSYEQELEDSSGDETTSERYRAWIELTYKWPRLLAER